MRTAIRDGFGADHSLRRLEIRPIGETGHDASLLTVGAIAPTVLDRDETDALLRDVLDASVDHVGVAPSHGDTELELAPSSRRRFAR